MKRFVAALFALSTMVGFIACSPTTTMNAPLIAKGLGLILEVDKLAECEEYTALFSASAEIADTIKSIAENDYTEPKAVFMIEDLDTLVFESLLPNNTKLPSEIEAMVKGRFAGALPSQINAMSGVTSLAAASILNHNGSFIYKGLKDSVVYLYTYDICYSFMVAFTPGDENIVSASVAVVINDDLSKCSAKEDVVRFFVDALNFEDVSVSVLTKEG